jgi:hypothetical protein
VTFRSVAQLLILAFLLTCCVEVSHAFRLKDLFSDDDFDVYVGDRPYPGDFDPYFNEPKFYRQPRYYTSTSKKTKGNKIFKTTKVKDQYGNVVYKKTTQKKKGKK